MVDSIEPLFRILSRDSNVSLEFNLFFLENLAKAGKAIQAILDATGTRRGKIFTIVLVLLLIVRSEQFCVTLQK